MENLINLELTRLKSIRDSFELNTKENSYYSNLIQILIPAIGTNEYTQIDAFQKYTNRLMRNN